MDQIDARIIRCLVKDARMNASQIGQKVNLSVSAVIERMKKMESSGLIRGYSAIINEKMAGYPVQAMISVRLGHSGYAREFSRQVQSQTYVISCYSITGEYDYILHVIAASTEDFVQILQDIEQIPGVLQTRTSIVLDTVKQSVSAVFLNL